MFDAKKMVRLGLALAALVISLPAMKEFVLSRFIEKQLHCSSGLLLSERFSASLTCNCRRKIVQ